MRKPWIWRGYVDLSWNKFNLFNLYKYSRSGAEKEMNKTTFQLRWRAKQLTIPYHAGHITQHQFLHQQQRKLPVIKRVEPSKSLDLPYPPTTMLTFGFMERHVDVAIFRACFVQSIWEARSLVKRGHVTVNGSTIRAPNYILEDGDIVQVRPDKLSLLNPAISYSTDEESGKSGEEAEEAGKGEEGELTNDADNQVAKQLEEHGESRNKMYASEDYGLQPAPYMAPWLFVPEYLEVNYNNLSFFFLRSPTIKPGKCEIPSPYDEVVHQRVYDFYSNYRKL